MSAADEQTDYGSTTRKSKGSVAGNVSGGAGAVSKVDEEEDAVDLSMSMDAAAMGDMNQVIPLSYHIHSDNIHMIPMCCHILYMISYTSPLIHIPVHHVLYESLLVPNLPFLLICLISYPHVLLYPLVQAIASFMIHSAVALADQLKKCGGLKLREEDMRKWERELRVLNVTRASLTTQLVAARKQVRDG